MEFLGVPLVDDDIFKLAVRFLFDLFFLVLILKLAIQPNNREREFAFSVVMMNITVFFICFTLKKLDLGLGMALGLFAIFGILRYRADAIRTKEMTYLFIVIALAVINSLSNRKTSYLELVMVNSCILGGAMLKETILFRAAEKQDAEDAEAKANSKTAKTNSNGNGNSKKDRKYTVRYDRLQWLGPDQRPDLLNDLSERTGMRIHKVRIQDIDLAAQSATLQVWADESDDPDDNQQD